VAIRAGRSLKAPLLALSPVLVAEPAGHPATATRISRLTQGCARSSVSWPGSATSDRNGNQIIEQNEVVTPPPRLLETRRWWRRRCSTNSSCCPSRARRAQFFVCRATTRRRSCGRRPFPRRRRSVLRGGECGHRARHGRQPHSESSCTIPTSAVDVEGYRVLPRSHDRASWSWSPIRTTPGRQYGLTGGFDYSGDRDPEWSRALKRVERG